MAVFFCIYMGTKKPDSQRTCVRKNPNSKLNAEDSAPQVKKTQ